MLIEPFNWKRLSSIGAIATRHDGGNCRLFLSIIPVLLFARMTDETRDDPAGIIIGRELFLNLGRVSGAALWAVVFYLTGKPQAGFVVPGVFLISLAIVAMVTRKPETQGTA